MNLQELLMVSTKQLCKPIQPSTASVSSFPKNIDTPWLDALIILCHVLGIEKEEFFARTREEANNLILEQCTRFINRRKTGEPIAYLTGKKEFFGIELRVDSRVLVPRPETETLVELVLSAHNKDDNLNLHDACTGSGAIAIAIQKACPNWQVSASDISPSSLVIFEENWKRHIGKNGKGARIPWEKRDILSPQLRGNSARFHIITANPPYLSSQEASNALSTGGHEPPLALDGGIDGLVLIRRLVQQAPEFLLPKGMLYFEAADWQSNEILAILSERGFFNICITRDLAGQQRIYSAQFS